MNKIAALVILCLIMVSVFAQINQSYFYNEKGQFLLDTTLTITKNQYYKWERAENNLLAALSNIDYPVIQLDNYIETKEQVIVSFTIDSSGIKNIVVLNDSGAFANAIKDGIKYNGKRIVKLLKSKNEVITEEKYYIAYSFKLLKFYDELKKEKAIPIIRSLPPPSISNGPPLIKGSLKK